MRAMILCAGNGSRLGMDIPKGMLKINDEKLVDRQIRQFKEIGISNVTLVTGYKHEMFGKYNTIYDDDFANHDILGSIMSARKLLNDDIIISYSDIVFDVADLVTIAKSSYDFTILVDGDWQKKYEKRTDHPYKDADTVQILEKIVTKFAKGMINDTSEFIGLFKISQAGCDYFKSVYDEVYDRFKNARLIEFLQELTNRNFGIIAEHTSKEWFEIDTRQDYKYVLEKIQT